MDDMAWYSAGDSRASGQIRVRQGFSVGPSLTDSMPQVSLSKRSMSISGDEASSEGRASSVISLDFEDVVDVSLGVGEDARKA